jgi:hypothetical protein
MSLKSSLIKMAIKMTPDMMIVWVANIVLKGIAELTEFSFDLDTRKVDVQTKLYGETDIIQVSLDGFGLIKEDECYKFIIQQAQSNKAWLNNLLAHVVGKAVKIPVIPMLAGHMAVIYDVFKIEISK